MQLYIGNKNYSSWSMRAWVLMTHAGVAFREVKLRLSFTEGSEFKQALAAVSPVGKVPVLVDNDVVVWDTLAISEYLAEKFPDRRLWPEDVKARAQARSVCAEMHSGFTALRNHLPMNIEASLPEIGERMLGSADVRRDVDRIVQMWTELLAQHGGPFLFGRFTIADAYFAPVCMRLRGYGVPVPAAIATYVERVSQLPAVQAWVKEALEEHDFLDFDEPYRTSREG